MKNRRFEKLRKRKTLTQVKLAAEMGLSQASIASWETGRSRPQSKDLPKLANVLNCTVEELVRCFAEKDEES